LIEVEANQLSEAFGNPGNHLLQRLEEALSDWEKWAKNTIFGTEHESAWDPERQEYAFSVAAPGFDEDIPILHFLLINIPEDTWTGLLSL
jgi:hypothetical protein